MSARSRFVSRVRGLPGVMAARRRIVMRVRHSQTLRRMAQRIFAVDAAASVPSDVAAGRVIGGVGTESLPVVLVVVIEADAATMRDVVDETARLQLLGAGFRPVIVTDVEAFAHIRRYGYPVELLISRAEWRGPESWERYMLDRLALLFLTYRANASVTIGRDGLDTAARLVLLSLRPDAVALSDADQAPGRDRPSFSEEPRLTSP